MPKKDNRLIIYEKTTNLIIYSKNLLNKYPKSERFDLCADIKNTLYQIIELIIFAWKEKNSIERIKILNRIDSKLYLLKTLTKLSHELYNDKYSFSKYRKFKIYDPKEREILSLP